MSRRTLDVVDLVELFVHWEAGRSQVQISESLGLDRKTVRKYLAPAVADGLVPGGVAVGEGVWAERIAGWFPQVADGRLRQVTWPALEAHRDYIVGQLTAGVTVATISQRLIDEKGLSASRSSLRRWIAGNLSELTLRDKVSVPKPPAPPGSVARHRDGTTLAGFLPTRWDHCSASCGTTRRVLTPTGPGRLFDLLVLFSDVEVADDGVPGGRRD